MSSSNSAGSAAARRLLCLCLFVSIFSEVLLSPFYPQFFEKVFSINGTAFTGFFIFACRLAVMISTPIWGKLSQKIGTSRLFLIALGCSPFFSGALAFANTPALFLFITVLMLTVKSSLLLIYPLLAETNGAASTSRHYQLLFHGAIISASICGAVVMMHQSPERVFLLLALIDALLFLLLWVSRAKLPVSPVRIEKKRKFQRAGLGIPVVMFFLFGAAVFAFHLGNNVIRPYFTLYAENTFFTETFMSSILFMLPNAAALLVMPWMHKWVTKNNALSFSVLAVFILSVTLFIQWGVSALWLFAAARVLYGVFLASGQAAIDASFFHRQNAGNTSYAYSLLLLFQNAALLTAPLAAAYTASAAGHAVPFLAGALILMGAFAALYHLSGENQKIESPYYSNAGKRKEDIT
ncbi:MFS transporter [Alteribacillus sp. HJP-4]|uniref:MFS transporter n=1 Tax=Alteribacillus sp. HJP-4 TaxID=2775394 RepID=UPI0035CCE6C9